MRLIHSRRRLPVGPCIPNRTQAVEVRQQSVEAPRPGGQLRPLGPCSSLGEALVALLEHSAAGLARHIHAERADLTGERNGALCIRTPLIRDRGGHERKSRDHAVWRRPAAARRGTRSAAEVSTTVWRRWHVASETSRRDGEASRHKAAQRRRKQPNTRAEPRLTDPRRIGEHQPEMPKPSDAEPQ